jgi:hypothetical protein
MTFVGALDTFTINDIPVSDNDIIEVTLRFFWI